MYMLHSYKYLKYFLPAISFPTINLEGDKDNSTMFIDLKILSSMYPGIWFKTFNSY